MFVFLNGGGGDFRPLLAIWVCWVILGYFFCGPIFQAILGHFWPISANFGSTHFFFSLVPTVRHAAIARLVALQEFGFHQISKSVRSNLNICQGMKNDHEEPDTIIKQSFATGECMYICVHLTAPRPHPGLVLGRGRPLARRFGRGGQWTELPLRVLCSARLPQANQTGGGR